MAGSLKSRIREKIPFTRRFSTTPSAYSSEGERKLESPKLKAKSVKSATFRVSQRNIAGSFFPLHIAFHEDVSADSDEDGAASHDAAGDLASSDYLELRQLHSNDLQSSRHEQPTLASSVSSLPAASHQTHIASPTTDSDPTPATVAEIVDRSDPERSDQARDGPLKNGAASEPRTKTKARQAPEFIRRQSILPRQQTELIETLLETDVLPSSAVRQLDYLTTHSGPSTISANMVNRKIWVKRPNASATLVPINEDDVVDDVRDMILRKYANSLGKNFDAPDVTLRICPREASQERVLGPEEPMSRTLDAYFPGGQTVDEALVIDVPLRRTPKPSPRGGPLVYYHDEQRPIEAASEYFPPMPAPNVPSPHLPATVPVSGVNGGGAHQSVIPAHSMAVLTTGHVPNLPSPGAARRHYQQRPRVVRTHTTSPTLISGHVPAPSAAINEHSAVPPAPPPLPSPPTQDTTQIQRVSTPPPTAPTPRVGSKPPKKNKSDHPSLPAGLLNGGVPPINVLIVEDNIINLKLLEAFMKKLKVRCEKAMNGKEAVTKWRAGGFHLVLMDIQLPVMNGLEATREIRRLEKLNSIGVFSSSASSSAPETADEPEGEDRLPSSVLFKSPVIIVALTASSLQSDRHEALAAGCNDFLTKPVNFVWLERKVMEWGCMQALIDFDGWRKWKDFSQQGAENDSKKGGTTKKTKKNRISLGANGTPGG
ncbi:MAG: ssk1 response regulator receiver [Claussenomyces sp. TS43310]|nr:MAG: ssk1 response regulator receiver [Claussenomyces sp. TS43310]